MKSLWIKKFERRLAHFYLEQVFWALYPSDIVHLKFKLFQKQYVQTLNIVDMYERHCQHPLCILGFYSYRPFIFVFVLNNVITEML